MNEMNENEMNESNELNELNEYSNIDHIDQNEYYDSKCEEKEEAEIRLTDEAMEALEERVRELVDEGERNLGKIASQVLTDLTECELLERFVFKGIEKDNYVHVQNEINEMIVEMVVSPLEQKKLVECWVWDVCAEYENW